MYLCTIVSNTNNYITNQTCNGQNWQNDLQGKKFLSSTKKSAMCFFFAYYSIFCLDMTKLSPSFLSPLPETSNCTMPWLHSHQPSHLGSLVLGHFGLGESWGHCPFFFNETSMCRLYWILQLLPHAHTYRVSRWWMDQASPDLMFVVRSRPGVAWAP